MNSPGLLFYLFLFAAALFITAFSVKHLIPALKRGAEQPIYEGGPSWHMSKSGTPTMGGISFLITLAVLIPIGAVYISNTLGKSASFSLILTAAYAFLNSMIGIYDDILKLKRKQNGGLTPIQKLVLQTAASVLLLICRHLIIGNETALKIGELELEMGVWYYPLTVLVLVGITNCANLTDGIDGLASGVAFAISVILFFISYVLASEITVISAISLGISIGFLIYNINPAKIFMGDTGSLLFGSLLAAAAVALGNPLLILVVGAVYCIEGASVILQVLWYKLTKKRLFKMAPLHHHLERNGWNENKICIAAIALTMLFSLPALAMLIT